MTKKKNKQRQQKHVPQRTCVGCRQKHEKRALTRVVLTSDEGVVIDPTGKRNGRGTYLCNKPVCWDNAIKRNTLGTALKTELTEADRARILAGRSSLHSAET